MQYALFKRSVGDLRVREPDVRDAEPGIRSERRGGVVEVVFEQESRTPLLRGAERTELPEGACA